MRDRHWTAGRVLVASVGGLVVDRLPTANTDELLAALLELEDDAVNDDTLALVAV